MTSLPVPVGAKNYTIGATWSGGLMVAPGEICYPRSYNGFAYKATQAKTARTGTVEPTWPTVAGNTVVDGGVTWTCFTLTTIVWTAFDLFKNGAAEPAWPTAINGTVVNGTITYACRAPTVKDVKCPHSTGILAAASKVFAIDDDVVRYSATLNPLGWSPKLYPSDAGFLDTGSQMQGEPTAKALALFRGNLAVLAYSSAQVWQLDPDPARIALVDTIEGVGTPYARAHAAVQGDLLITTRAGVRSLTTASQNEGNSTYDVGTPIDELVVAALAAADAAGQYPLAIYSPGRNEAWFFIGNQAFVLRSSKTAGTAAWSRFTLPGVVDDVAVVDSDLYFHVPATGKVYKYDLAAWSDDGVAIAVSGETPFCQLGGEDVDSMILGLDAVASGAFNVTLAYDEANPSTVTSAFPISGNTKKQGTIPVHLNAVPTLSARFSQSSTTAWTMDELKIHHEPLGTR